MTPPASAASIPKKKLLSLRSSLDALADQYETLDFIAADPISIPHRFSAPADIEVAGFFAAMFAWGQRPTILNKSAELLRHLDDAPHDWIVHHQAHDRDRLDAFVHRTFQPVDARYFVRRLQRHYQQHASLEPMFAGGLAPTDETVEGALRHFHDLFFDAADAPARTRKHVATPARGSSCKRLNMYLRWMVRPATRGVDFGLWRQISPRQLVMPLDVHVRRQAMALGLLKRKQTDWRAALELTATLRKFDANDPVRYDYALFGLGVSGEGAPVTPVRF